MDGESGDREQARGEELEEVHAAPSVTRERSASFPAV
jgi:hypothetical protein